MKGRVLIVAGSDSGGGAGIQADIKTVTMLDAFAATAVTALTAQNTEGVFGVLPIAPDFIRQQMEVVLDDIGADAIKTGMLHDAGVIESVAAVLAERAANVPLVVDPVILTKHHAALLTADAIEALKTLLFPRTFLLTPNLPEAAMLTRTEVSDPASMRRAAEMLAAMGPKAVLLKGGHLVGDAIDILFHEGKWLEFSAPRIDTRHTHGTGCTYSAAITASLASGDDLPTAVGRAKRYITAAIISNPGLGAGSGPVNHHAAVPLEAGVLRKEVR